jgi:hypothetical protein
VTSFLETGKTITFFYSACIFTYKSVPPHRRLFGLTQTRSETLLFSIPSPMLMCMYSTMNQHQICKSVPPHLRLFGPTQTGSETLLFSIPFPLLISNPVLISMIPFRVLTFNLFSIPSPHSLSRLSLVLISVYDPFSRLISLTSVHPLSRPPITFPFNL